MAGTHSHARWQPLKGRYGPSPARGLPPLLTTSRARSADRIRGWSRHSGGTASWSGRTVGLAKRPTGSLCVRRRTRCPLTSAPWASCWIASDATASSLAGARHASRGPDTARRRPDRSSRPSCARSAVHPRCGARSHAAATWPLQHRRALGSPATALSTGTRSLPSQRSAPRSPAWMRSPEPWERIITERYPGQPVYRPAAPRARGRRRGRNAQGQLQPADEGRAATGQGAV